MKKILYMLLSFFIPSKRKRTKFLRKHKIYIASVKGGANNIVDIPHNRKIKINIIGKNNYIKIDKDLNVASDITLNLVGDNNTVTIGKASLMLNLSMGSSDDRAVYGTSFHFGNSNASITVPLNCVMMENNTSISIGDNCMFSWGIEFRCTDDHAILNDKDEVINLAKSITIGNHVWIAHGVLVLKNSCVPDGCVVGARSIVTGNFTKPNCVIVGVPARVVKENIHWNGERPDKYSSKKNK